MTSFFKLAFAFLIFGLSSALCYAATERSVLIEATYLSPAQVLPSPPAVDSVATRTEIAEVKDWMRHATTEQRALAMKDAHNKTVGFFADVIPGFVLPDLPETKKLFAQVRYTEDHFAKMFKKHFQRPRPYVTDPTIELCTEKEKGKEFASYPSGHSTMAYSMGVILAHMMPNRAPALLDRSRLYAENRIRCGAHHRSDIVAGQVLGTIVAIELLKNPTFQKMLADSQRELRMAGLIR